MPEPIRKPGDNSGIYITPGVSAFTGHGYIRLDWGETSGQLTIAEARQHGLAILEAAEAAEMDAAMWAFAKTMLHTDDAGAAAILNELRAFRKSEGTRGT